jgi:hypothetical protein
VQSVNRSTLVALVLGSFLSVQICAQPNSVPQDFSLTLERIGCLGECPDYKVTIDADGVVQYEGRAYVMVQRTRSRKMKPADLQKLIAKLEEVKFFEWETKDCVCVDFPEVHISVTMAGRHNKVLEGCNTPGKILELAKFIDKVSGAKRRWVG